MTNSQNNSFKFGYLKTDYYKNRLKLFEKFIDKINEGVLVFNENGSLLYANEKANKKFNLTRTKIKHYKFWNLIQYYGNSKDWQDLTIKLKQKKNIKFIDKKSEYYLSVEIYLHCIENVNYYVLIYSDITENTNDKIVIAEKITQIDLFERNFPAVIFKLEINDKKQSYFTYISQSLERLFGFKLETYNSNWHAKLKIHPDDIVDFYNTMFESLEQFTSFKYIVRLIVNGMIFWCDVKAEPSIQNNKINFDGIILDITKRKEDEIEIEQKRAFNDSVLMNIPADIAVFDKYHRYLFINFNGVINEELRQWLIGKTDFDYCEYRGLDTSIAKIRSVYFNQAKESKQQVDWIDTIKKEETTFYILRRFFPFCVDDVFVYMIGYGVDITELKMAQLNLSDAEKENELILKSALDGVIMMDKDFKITFLNPQSEAIFGWKTNQLIGKKKLQNLLPREIESVHDIPSFISQNNSSNIQKRTEFLATNKKGNDFPIELNIVNIDEVENKINYCLFVRDITNKKAKELEVEIQNKALIKQNKSLEQFNYIASHDLQEPLVSLISFSNLLEEEYGDILDSEGKLFLQFINKSANRMRSLIAGLLEYTRINPIENLSQTNLNLVVEDVLNNLYEKIDKYKAKIIVNELPVINCSHLYLSILFQNLISNGIKFSKNDQSPCIEISCEEKINYWLFKIQDNGLGIPKEGLNEIFIMFRRLHNQDEYTGYGIGLAYCKRIVELHNGEIWVESTLGKGSAFYFTISKEI